MSQFSEKELEEALSRAFVTNKADYVFLYRNSGRFLLDGIKLGIKNEWLEEKFVVIDEQETQLRYYLTPVGKKHFGIEMRS